MHLLFCLRCLSYSDFYPANNNHVTWKYRTAWLGHPARSCSTGHACGESSQKGLAWRCILCKALFKHHTNGNSLYVNVASGISVHIIGTHNMYIYMYKYGMSVYLICWLYIYNHKYNKYIYKYMYTVTQVYTHMHITLASTHHNGISHISVSGVWCFVGHPTPKDHKQRNDMMISGHHGMESYYPLHPIIYCCLQWETYSRLSSNKALGKRQALRSHDIFLVFCHYLTVQKAYGAELWLSCH